MNASTLRDPMLRPFYIASLLIALALGFGSLAEASVVFKPGEHAKYVAPGEEEINGNAQQLFQAGQEAEKANKMGRAIKAYRTLVRKYPKDALAAGAGYRCAELQEQTHDYLNAASSYRWIVERYPSSPNFNEAIEAQFRIGEMYLNGKKIKFMGISIANALDRSVEIFAAIIRTAPFGKYTARAQFDIGRAREKEGANDAAVQAYQAVIDKFPNAPIAADAQYQIGYIWFVAARQGTNDSAAALKARTAFQDFLFRYPNSEKAAQARMNLQQLQQKTVNSAFDIARYYDKQKHYRAAVIYYNEVIRQQPGSNESERSKKRIDELKAKLGEEALKPAFAKAEAESGKKKGAGSFTGANAAPKSPGGRSSAANNAAPLPPPESDGALPPPATLMPDGGTAPSSGSNESGSSAGTETSGASDPAASPAP